MDAIIAAGYPYELAGLMYYVFFLIMGRNRNRATYGLRSRILVLLAAIVMVACVPLHYATIPFAVGLMVAVATIALLSTIIDVVGARARRG